MLMIILILASTAKYFLSIATGIRISNSIFAICNITISQYHRHRINVPDLFAEVTEATGKCLPLGIFVPLNENDYFSAS